MTTLTETYCHELLDAVGHPDQVEVVLKRHGHSKGPLYIALAQATTSLTERLNAVSDKSRKTE